MVVTPVIKNSSRSKFGGQSFMAKATSILGGAAARFFGRIRPATLTALKNARNPRLISAIVHERVACAPDRRKP